MSAPDYDSPYSEEWNTARNRDKEVLEKSGQLAISSCIPGWVATRIGAGFNWMTRDVAKDFSKDLYNAIKQTKQNLEDKQKPDDDKK